MDKNITNWTVLHSVLMIGTTVYAVVFHAQFVLIWAVTLSIGFFVYLNYNKWKELKPVGGYANIVTALRFVLLIFAIAIHAVIHEWMFVALMIIVMAADGIDGYLARKYHHASAFGEVFDMEVDAFLALSLSFLIWLDHHDAWWVLGAGLLRYLFVLIYRMLRWHKRRRPSMPESKVFAVIFFAALLTPFVLSWSKAVWCAAFGCVLVSYSFLREFLLFMQPRS